MGAGLRQRFWGRGGNSRVQGGRFVFMRVLDQIDAKHAGNGFQQCRISCGTIAMQREKHVRVHLRIASIYEGLERVELFK